VTVTHRKVGQQLDLKPPESGEAPQGGVAMQGEAAQALQ